MKNLAKLLARIESFLINTVKPVLSSHSKKAKQRSYSDVVA